MAIFGLRMPMSKIGFVLVKNPPENRVESSSNFQFSGPFNEMVVMGVLAVRLSGLHGLHRELLWDGENMKFTNISPTDTIKIVTVDEF